MNENITFLLGAGAVADVKLPTAVQLQEIVENDIIKNFQSLLPAFRYISGAIQFGKACKGQPQSNKVNIEELLIACSFLALRNENYVYPFVSAWHELIERFQTLPQDIQSDHTRNTFEFLGRYCKANLKNWLDIKEPHLLKYFWSFKEFIDQGYKLRIFTLNYDECIECSLNKILGPINERWTTGFDDKGWKPTLLTSSSFDAYLYKLHGSLDWVNDPKLGICSVKWPAARDSEELPSDFDPLLIFGTDSKVQSIDPYLSLFFHFQRCLSSSKVVVIIGYSFGDKHINDMLLEALRRDPQMRCIVAHKTLPPEKLLPPEFEKMVGLEERFVYIPQYAKEAFETNSILKQVEVVLTKYKDEAPF